MLEARMRSITSNPTMKSSSQRPLLVKPGFERAVKSADQSDIRNPTLQGGLFGKMTRYE